jgi:hypothetical protein
MHSPILVKQQRIFVMPVLLRYLTHGTKIYIHMRQDTEIRIVIKPLDGLCGLVVGVSGYGSRGPGL